MNNKDPNMEGEVMKGKLNGTLINLKFDSIDVESNNSIRVFPGKTKCYNDVNPIKSCITCARRPNWALKNISDYLCCFSVNEITDEHREELIKAVGQNMKVVAEYIAPNSKGEIYSCCPGWTDESPNYILRGLSIKKGNINNG